MIQLIWKRLFRRNGYFIPYCTEVQEIMTKHSVQCRCINKSINNIFIIVAFNFFYKVLILSEKKTQQLIFKNLSVSAFCRRTRDRALRNTKCLRSCTKNTQFHLTETDFKKLPRSLMISSLVFIWKKSWTGPPLSDWWYQEILANRFSWCKTKQSYFIVLTNVKIFQVMKCGFASVCITRRKFHISKCVLPVWGARVAYSYTRFPPEAELDTPDYGIIETSVTPDLDWRENKRKPNLGSIKFPPARYAWSSGSNGLTIKQNFNLQKHVQLD